MVIFTCSQCGCSIPSCLCPTGVYYTIPATSFVTINQSNFSPFVVYSEPYPFRNKDSSLPTTLGFRGWFWLRHKNRLVSPVIGTFWEDSELIAPNYEGSSYSEFGQGGVHAYIVPENWKNEGLREIDWDVAHTLKNKLGYSRRRCWSDSPYPPSEPYIEDFIPIKGIIERYGKYTLGTRGWRAERAVIRQLLAPNTEIGLALEKQYPEVEILYPDQDYYPNNSTWENEKNSYAASLAAAMVTLSQLVPTQSITFNITVGQPEPEIDSTWTKVKTQYGLGPKELERAIRKLEVSYQKRDYDTQRKTVSGNEVLFVRKKK